MTTILCLSVYLKFSRLHRIREAYQVGAIGMGATFNLVQRVSRSVSQSLNLSHHLGSAELVIGKFRNLFNRIVICNLDSRFVESFRLVIEEIIRNFHTFGQSPVSVLKTIEHLYTLGLIEHFEPVILNIVFQQVTQTVHSKCANSWTSPSKLKELQVWINDELGTKNCNHIVPISRPQLPSS